MKFEWDGQKAKANLRKHRLDFHEASSVFEDSLALTFPDEDHSDEEPREITIGCTIMTTSGISLTLLTKWENPNHQCSTRDEIGTTTI